MKKAFIDPAMCDGLPTCVVKFTCPVKAVSQKYGPLGGVSSVDKDKCIDCGKCAAICPHHAVRMQ
ncbi:MAG: 4Fe-4S binding protein [Elusimicrobiaceae bacterium]